MSAEEYLEGVQQAEREAAANLLGTKSVARVEESVAGAVDFAERLSEFQREASPPERPIDCKEGCAWCCHFPVAVSAAEVIRIGEHLRASRSPEQLATLRSRAIEADERRRGGDARARTSTPCPLLENGRCIAYDVRPLSCRGCNSFDARACERHYWSGRGTMPVHAAQHEIHSSVFAGLIHGLRDAALDAQPLELVAALRVALERPDAASRWLKGASAFEGAYFLDTLPEVVGDLLGELALKK